MSCIACFIDDNYQKQLKGKCFGIKRFENKLIKYKELYINDFKKLVSISQCSCNYQNSNPDYIRWTDFFLQNMQDNIGEIEKTFDELTEIYLSYISKSNKVAIDKIWSFLINNSLLSDSQGALAYTRLLFRARPKGTFNSSDINELFHIPFDLRERVSSQRFSIAGQPMLYLSNSIISIEKELGLPIDDVAIAGFLPKYYLYYGKKIYEIKNSIFDVIVKTLPSLFNADSQIDYYSERYRPNYKSIVIDIKKSILSQILTFPVENKNSFVEEYVLPQMITTALLEHDYKGIIFPSTKDFSNLKTNNLNSEHELNIAFYVNYNNSQRLDSSLLDSFFHFTLDGSEDFNITVNDIRDKISSIVERNKKGNHNNNDFLIPLAHIDMHLKNLEDSNIKGTKYFDTKYGKIELELYMKMVKEMDKNIK